MTGFLANLKTPVYALFRIVFAFLYWCHGLVWLFNAFGGRPVPEMPPLLWTAGVIETVLGILIGIGLFTPLAAFIASGEMACAYFIAHVPRGSIFPIENMGEITVALCFGFLYVATTGGGPFSVDALLAGKKREARVI